MTSLYTLIVHATNLRGRLDLRGPTSSLWTLSPKHTSFLSTTATNQVQIVSILHWCSYNDFLIDLPLSAPILSTHGGCMLLNAALIMLLPCLHTFCGVLNCTYDKIFIYLRGYTYGSSTLVFGYPCKDHAKRLQLTNPLENHLGAGLPSVCSEEQMAWE